MTVDTMKLIRMGEQITANMQFTNNESVVAARVAEHLQKFWDPRMQAAIAQLAAEDDSQLSPVLRAAVARLSLR